MPHLNNNKNTNQIISRQDYHLTQPCPSEEKQTNKKKKLIHLAFDLSAETLQARREWQDIFKVLKGKNLQPRSLYPARISFKIDGEIKYFSDKQKFREFSTAKPALPQMLKELI